MSKATISVLHFFTILFFFTLSFFHGNAQNVTAQEQTILLQLKDYWSSSTNMSHWIPSSDHCTWPEVTCTDGRVTKLKIINNNISETIPTFICDLKNLSYIDLHENFIPGPFPAVLYNCYNLEYLDLQTNHLVGRIPDDINRLSPWLQVLNLSGNNFSGDIPASIGSFPELKSLQLSFNMFNGSIPPEIGNLSNLEELNLNFNPFLPQQAIPSSFTKLKKLRNLWMYITNLIGEIPESVGNLPALEFLDLSENGLNGSIPDSLFLLKNLTIVFLFKNRLSGSIPQTVEALNLEVIDLSENNLTGIIPDDFEKLTNLTGLALYFNQLSGNVPVGIGRLPSLIDIGLFSNNLLGELPPDFGLYSTLRTFQVASNHFVGTLPKNLCANKALRGMVVFDNNLTGELPESLGNCDSLEVVRVYGNRFSGNIPGGLWTSLNLTTLMMSDNLFTGQLPDKVGPNMSLLEMNNNQFSGEIPAGISSWENLEVFKASNNLLTGKIPQELTVLPLLSTILLDGNKLSSNLPSKMISWKSLTILNLSRNQLSGEIPAAIGFLPKLMSLDLSANNFSGPIPPEIGHLRLSSLNLSSNQLTGRIPGEFENAAFNSSFQNNPRLCARNRASGLSSCQAAPARKSNKLPSHLIATVSSISAVAFLVVFVYTILVVRTNRRKHDLEPTWKVTSFQRLNFTESTISSGLIENNIIGRGGSGTVFRIPINRSGAYVAVKRIWNNVKLELKLEKEFLSEVQVLGTIRHSNIVKLLCCISSHNSKLLVYEYMENRSLDRWLHGKNRPSTISGSIHNVVLDWPKRLQIAIDAAQGLSYMHHDCSPSIIHRDVKSSNILLDSEFNAKIADFGLARMLIKNGEPDTMSTVAGSFGYIAPEYAQTRRVNEKVDVYSFGVILLELVTRREARDGDESSSLAEWAWHHIQEGKHVVDAMDEDIKEPQYLDEISSVFKLGIICTSKFPSNRPTMKEVLQILLRCSHSTLHGGEKMIRNEYDVAPLLQNLKPERKLEPSDSD